MHVLEPDTLIRNPQGCQVVSSVEIAAPAASVWNIVGNFAGFPVFIPALSHIDMTGSGVRSVRKKLFKDGNVVIEQLNSRDEQAMTMTWSLIYTSLNIGNLWAAMQVEALDGQHSRATWTIQAEPWEGGAEALPGFQAFLQGFADEAMGNVRTLLS
ncbi:SRPBCC family protein [Pseudomonas sp. S 311-6]|uniref:SRPBCC family protein n=1 Tax=Pseudomonas TaxID=286 RepID=UPI002097A4BA|nr:MULTISPECIES: SRPBCC family protein [Pseudomonas]MCO7641982.1 SRPBCC family protein [Pseudomonas sp. S 311-6]MCO7566995.1 SRPBCC family protein [Pseudomonas mosselii]MCO7597077.1 SRPBCC family protein [Pseudomonas guariconensis]MCO7618335.1 SRPBCC family protein [Pseudomonas guariconensis]MCO7634223.1 SRPBCC family protein [Pseudomonas guariconensis]